jgi:hypothetical protein
MERRKELIMQTKKLSTSLSIFFLVLIAPLILLAADYYVAPTASGTGNCSSPTDACEFQTALDNAAGNGQHDTIHLAAGTYDASVATFTYHAMDLENYALTLEGAGTDATMLDGGGTNQNLNIETRGLSYDSNAHISIKGITFQNGNAYIGAVSNSGGGVHVRTDSANITLKDSKFSENSAYWEGGGADAYTVHGTVTLTNNIFSGNSADIYGGGTSADSQNGSVILTNNTFNENSIEDYGGGANVSSYSGTVTITNNSFSGNSADIHGGGVEVSSTIGTVSLTNNIFTGNFARYYGGGAHIYLYSEGTVTLTNNTFSGNYTDGEGGGTDIRLRDNSSTANIYNNIVWNNTAVQYGSDISLIDDANNDGLGAKVNLYNNDYSEFFIVDGDNLLQGNNINTDPLFVDPDNGDYHLQAYSPCIDQGDPNAPELPDKDFEGDDRIIGAAPDIGADEFALVTIGDILDDIENLIDTGVLSQGQGNAFIAILGAAEKMLNEGNTIAACNQLHAFINQVNAYIKAEILSVEEGQSLIDAAKCVISQNCE